MFKNKGKSLEFLTLFTMVIGTVVGLGIYFKNSSLLGETQNPIIAIVLWIVVGLVSVATVYIFLEIASSTKHFGNGTVGNWTKLMVNRKTASFFSLVYKLIYTPSCQSMFAIMFASIFFQLIGVNLNATETLFLYIFIGGSTIVLTLLTQMYSLTTSRRVQVFGTIFKFIPLLIVLVAGVVLGIMNPENGAMLNGGTPGHEWSTSNFEPSLFIRGFGGILFSFDGFIYIANTQRTAKHKEVVPKALIAGMIVVSVFYVLMAVSLFLGSPDGSVTALLNILFTGGSTEPSVAATVITNIIMLVICFLGVNIFSYIGVVGLNSDADSKIVYSKGRSLDMVNAGWRQIISSIIVFLVLILLGYFLRDDSNIIFNDMGNDYLSNGAYMSSMNNELSRFADIMSSTVSCMAFGMISVLIFAGIRNRYTKKVEVEYIKGFIPLAWICGILFTTFSLLGVYAFIIPIQVQLNGESWVGTNGMWFTILLALNLVVCGIAHFIQEQQFKRDPYTDGYDGEHKQIAEHKKMSEVLNNAINKIRKTEAK